MWFPYRAHLEAEIVWLKQQLAQANRRADSVLELTVAVRRKPEPEIQQPKTPQKPVTAQPLGWDAYREQHRKDPVEEKANG